MTKNRTIRTAAFAASLAAWCGWGITEARAQSAWIVGNEWARMDPPSGGIVFAPLPVQPNEPNAYHGDPVTRSSYIQLDPEGYPLFFIVDGNVYDGEGYLIAPVLADDAYGNFDGAFRTDGQLFGARGRILVEPVPDKCGLWYVFHQRLFPALPVPPWHQLQMSVIDMTADNTFFPESGKKGRVCDLTDMLANGIVSSSNAADPFNLSIGYIPDNFLIEPGANNGVVHFESVYNSSTGRTMLLAFTGYTLTLFEIHANGVTYLTTMLIQEAWNGRNRAKGEIGVASNGPLLRIALPVTRGGFINPTEFHESWILLLTLDLALPVPGLLGDLEEILIDRVPISPVLLNEQGGEIWYPGTGGVEFSPNGRYSYWLNSYRTDNGPNGSTGYIGYYDWNNTSLHFLDVQDALPFIDSQMERGAGPDGVGAALFVSGTTALGEHWLGAVLNPDDPASAIWVPDAIEVEGASLSVDGSIAQLIPATDRYHLLPKGSREDQWGALSGPGDCCARVHTMLAFEGHMVSSGVASWNSVSNPFDDRTVIRITGDLRFQAGADVTAHDLEFRMDEHSAIVIEEGAQFDCFNCTFTNACPDALWKGFRVEGDRYDLEQDGGHQGQLRLFGCTVDKANVGVWCGREVDAWTAHPSYGGGAVRAYGCTFRNCRIGARVEGYHRYDGNGAELPNLSYFEDCLFETTVAWTTDFVPEAHIYLRDVAGIDIKECTFRNTAPELFELHYRGQGIFALDAGFRCLGFAQYDDHYFQDLYAGVVASVPDPAKAYTVDGMGFHGNSQGVADLGSTDARITNNRFVLRGADAPSEVATVGIQLFQSERYTVERNTFTDQGENVPSVGVWFVGPSVEDNRIYDNEFTALTIGSFVEGRHRSSIIGIPQIEPGLQLLCGDHTGNGFDQFVLQEGYVKYDQGLPTFGDVTANNRFLSPATCGAPGGTNYHVGFWAWSDYGLDVRYNYYDNAGSPEMRPDCIEDANGDPISFIGEWFYDLQDVAVPIAFDKETHCPNGVIDQLEGPGIDGIAELAELYSAKQDELRSALAQYKGTVDRSGTGGVLDQGETLLGYGPDTRKLLSMLAHQPWHPSHLLRDTLLASFPLSDAVLTAAILRGEAIDPWHLTQVLIQNSPLSGGIWRVIRTEEPLPSYFHDLLLQYRGGIGLRGLLEQEVALRQQEKARMQHLLLSAWASDSTLAGRRDSIAAIFQADSLGDGLRGLYLSLIHGGDYAGALALDGAMEDRGYSYLTAWGKVLEGTAGDWSQMGPENRDGLLGLAYGHEQAVGALAWATLFHVNVLDSLPTPEVPEPVKTLWTRKTYRAGRADEHGLLGVLPNPADDRIAFTYPDGMEQGRIEVFNAQGQLVRSIALNGRKGMFESSVVDLGSGFYSVRLVQDGFTLTTAKFTVMR